MKDKPNPKGKSSLDTMLENSTDKKNAWKKIIQELEKQEINNKNQTKNERL